MSWLPWLLLHLSKLPVFAIVATCPKMMSHFFILGTAGQWFFRSFYCYKLFPLSRSNLVIFVRWHPPGLMYFLLRWDFHSWNASPNCFRAYFSASTSIPLGNIKLFVSLFHRIAFVPIDTYFQLGIAGFSSSMIEAPNSILELRSNSFRIRQVQWRGKSRDFALTNSAKL